MDGDARRPAGTPQETGALERLSAMVGSVCQKGPPPVERWNPRYCGEIDMRIAADGTWFYNGSPIGRLPLVKLFASILRKDPERYVLVTPVERVGILVEDAPFQAVEMAVEGEGPERQIAFRTNVDDLVMVDPEHPLRFEREPAGGIKPYVRVRGELWARVTRALTYDLIELGEERQAGSERVFGVAAGGAFHPIAPGSEAGDFLTMLASTDADSFEMRAARHLLREPPGMLDALAAANGDHALERDGWGFAAGSRPKPAAVLVAVVMHEDEATILFTERATHLRDHSGQIALPGGKIDPDETPRETALREAEEEIGLDRSLVRPVGYLDTYLASSGFVVFPVVGLVAPGFTLTLNTHEVADAFEVPLSFLMDASNHEIHAREWKGRIRQYYAMPFGDRYIWGVTAGILRNLYVRLYES